MTIWIDAQLSPSLAGWITGRFPVEAVHVRDLGLGQAEDPEIFAVAADEAVVVMTKDRDFLRLLEERGAPPQVIWVTVGNTSNRRMKKVLTEALPEALELLRKGEPLVEIGDSTHAAS